ncbi:MAG TPA: hypothetical protein VFY45_13625 [Baekduia sp.]|nr:hypothetical protein [Baekduia sp.]
MVTAILSAIALIVSVATAWRQSRQGARATLLPVVVDVLREFRSTEFKCHQAMLRRVPCDPLDETVGFEGIADPDVRESARYVSHFYDNVGLLIASGIATPEPIVAFLGNTANRAWETLCPYIKTAREQSTGLPYYQEFFEHLVSLSGPREVEAALDRMDLKTLNGRP